MENTEMDILTLVKSISALKETVSFYEDALKPLGVSLNDLPSDLKALLDEVAVKQMKANLPDLDETFLNEFYLLQKRKNIQKNFAAGKLKCEIQSLKNRIVETKSNSAFLEEFLNEINKSGQKEENCETLKALLNHRIADLKMKKAGLGQPDDFCLKDVIKKIEILEKKEEQQKPKRK